MENFEKEYRNRFRKQQIDVESSDSEAIWDAISDELPQASTAPNGTFKNYAGQITQIFALMLLALCWSIGIDHSKQVASKANFDHPEYWLNQTTTSEIYEISAPLGKPQEKNSFLDGSNDHKQPKSLSARSETIPFKQSGNPVGLQMDGTIDFNKAPSSIPLNVEKPTLFTGETTVLLDNKTNEFESLPLLTALSTSRSAGNSNSTFESLPLLPARDAFNYSQRFHIGQQHLWNDPDNNCAKKQKNMSVSIGMEYGAHYTNLEFVSQKYPEAASIKNAAEVPVWGNNAGLRLGLLWKKRWSLTTGIDYRQSWTAFNYMQIDSLPILKQDQLLRISINSVSGDTLQKIYGDTIVNTLFTRHVYYNNGFRQIGIPIDIGMRYDIGKWRIGGDIGAVLNMIVYQDRKGLDEQIKMRSTSDEPVTNLGSQFGIGIRINPVIGYQLGDRWALQIRPQWSWQQMQDPMSMDMQMHINQFSMLGGIHYLIK